MKKNQGLLKWRDKPIRNGTDFISIDKLFDLYMKTYHPKGWVVLVSYSHMSLDDQIEIRKVLWKLGIRCRRWGYGSGIVTVQCRDKEEAMMFCHSMESCMGEHWPDRAIYENGIDTGSVSF